MDVEIYYRSDDAFVYKIDVTKSVKISMYLTD